MKTSRLELGSSLIETLVALFVLAIGVLGVMSMQIKSIQFNKSSYLYSQASFLANDIYEGMLLTPEIADTYVIHYSDATPSKPSCGVGNDCSASQVVDWNLHNWRNNVSSLLPGGRSEIDLLGDQFVIRIEFEMGYEEDGTPQTIEYVMMADI